MRFSSEWLVEIAEQWSTALLLDIAVKATALVLLAMLFLRLLPRSSAALRHRVWCLTFGGLMALPALCYLLPAWAVPILPAWYQAPPRIAASSDAAAAADAAGRSTQPGFVEGERDPASDTATAESAIESLPEDRRLAAAPITPVAESVQSPSDDAHQASSIAGLIDPFAIWLAGAALCLLPLIAGIARSAILRARSRSVRDASWIALRDQTCARLGLTRAVQLLEVDPPIIPMSCGVLRPAVVLPKEACGWNEPLRRFVLLHELAHIKRHDVVFQLLARLACVLYWFHPLVWYAMHRLRIERELACDDAVLAAGERASDYAEQLLEVARRLQPVRPHAAVAMAQSNKLEHRVSTLFSRARSHLPLSPRASRLLLACAAGVVIAVSVVRPSARATDEEGKGEKASAEPIRRNQPQDIERSTAAARTEGRAADNDPLPAGAIARLGTTRFRPPRAAEAVSFLPDNRTLALTTLDGRLEHWDAQSGRFLREVRFAEPHVPEAAYTRDGRFVVARGWYKEGKSQNSVYWVALVDAQTGQERMRHELEMRYGGDHVVVADNASAIAVDGEKMMLVDLAKGEAIDWPLERLRPTALALSSEGSLLAVGSPGLVRIWKWRESREPRYFVIGRKDPRAQAHVNSIRFSPDGSLLAVGDHADGVSLMDLRTGREVQHLSMDGIDGWRGHHLAFSPDGRLLATPIETYDGGGVAMWDVASGKFAKRLQMPHGDVRYIAFSSDGRWLAGTDPFDSTLCVWNVQTGELLGRDLAGHKSPPNTIRFLPGDERLASAGEDSTVHLWNIRNAEPERVMKHESDPSGYVHMIRGMDVSPDGRYLASSCLDNTVRIWEGKTGRELRRLPGHGKLGGHRSVRFTPDSQRLASWGDDMRLAIYDVTTGKPVANHRLKPTGVEVPEGDTAADPFGARSDIEPFGGAERLSLNHGAFSPDGSRLVIAANAMHVFDTATGRELVKFNRWERGPVHRLAISKGNHYLLIAGWGYGDEIPLANGKTTREVIHRLQLRQLADGKLVAELNGKEGSWAGVAFSPDSRRAAIAVGKEERHVVILKIPEMTEVARIDGFRAPPRALEFSHSGKLLAVSNGDTSVVVYDLDKLPGQDKR